MDLKSVIAQISLFNILSQEEKEILVDSVKIEEFDLNQELFSSICDKIYFIISGMIKVQALTSEGTYKVLYFYDSGEFCTDVHSFLSGRKSKYNFVTVQPSKLMTITKERMDFVCNNYYNIQKCRGIWLENFCMKLTEDLEKFHFMTPEERYEDLLKSKPYLFQMLSNKDIASIIGIAPESFSRMLNRIVKKKNHQATGSHY